MPENGQDKVTEEPFQDLPDFGVFVGRDWELAELEQFLADRSSRKRIMLVYGPRGVGKSALVSEVARRGIEEGQVKNVIWLDRTRWAEYLEREPVVKEGTRDPSNLAKADTARFVYYFITKRDNTGDMPDKAIRFLREALTSPDCLLVIDDFDEDDWLGSEPGFCEQLVRITSPKKVKVILTTRLLKHSFPHRVFDTLEIGLLDEDEVRQLVNRCGLDRLDPAQLVNGGDLDATAHYIWKISGGLPEFIVRFLIRAAEQTEWLLDVDPGWAEAFEHFSAGYLSDRVQEKSPDEYRTKYPVHSQKCREKLQKISAEGRYVLLSLACEERLEALEEKELALTMGYHPGKKGAEFHRALAELHKERLIGCRLERGSRESQAHKRDQSMPNRKWFLLPFTREFIRNQLTDNEDAEVEFRQTQADRWIRFIGDYAKTPGHVEHQFGRIYASFSWCVANQEWKRVANLGKALCQLLWDSGLQSGQPKQSAQLIEICQKTADAAQQPEVDNWQTVVDCWMLLVELCLVPDYDSGSQDLVLEYIKKVVSRLEETKEEDGERWADVACWVASVCLRTGDITSARDWLNKVEGNGRGNKESWGALAYQIGKRYRPKDPGEAQLWLEKAIDVAHDPETATGARIDLAYLLHKGDPYQASQLVQQARDIIEDRFLSRAEVEGEGIKLLVRAITVEAQIAHHSADIQECAKLLKEARDLAKGAKLLSIEDTLKEYLTFVHRYDREFDPAGEIDRLFETPLKWEAVGVGQMCPICKTEFKREDLLENDLWHCPNCGTYSHIHCLSTIDDRCPNCRTPRIEMRGT